MICLSSPLPSLADQLRAYRMAVVQPLPTKGNPIAAASALENRKIIRDHITNGPKTCRQLEHITGLSDQCVLNHLHYLEKHDDAKRLSTRPVQWVRAK